jgi:outer membrane protein insertion porin family
MVPFLVFLLLQTAPSVEGAPSTAVSLQAAAPAGQQPAPSSASSPQPAAAAYVGERVASVSLEIEGRPTSDEALMNVIATPVGAPLSIAAVRETITHLYSLGRFDDVRVDAEHAPGGGVALKYLLTPIHAVSEVEFHGDLGLSESALRRRMADRFGATPSVGRAADVASTLEQYYREQGYLSAVVRVGQPIIAHNPDRTTLVFNVTAGPRARVSKVTVEGTPLDSEPQVLDRLDLSVGSFYVPEKLRAKLEAYATSMRRRGYYLATATERPSISDDRTSVAVSVHIDPGPLVSVRYEGDQLPKDKLAGLVPIESEGSVDPDILEDSARRITDYLRDLGYWKANVPPPDRREEDSRLIITFHINRGTLYRVAPGGLLITGNQSIGQDEIKDRLDRPATRLLMGDPFVVSHLDAAVGVVQALYQENGFPDAAVASASNEIAPGVVRPVITIKEGQQVRVGSIAVTGNKGLSSADILAVVQRLRSGAPFYAPNVAAARDAIDVLYLDHGYESAQVTPRITRSADGTRADITFGIQEGPQTIVDHILVVGNTRTDPKVIRRELLLEPGKPLSYSAKVESQRRLAALGLFRRVQITELPHGAPGSHDVVVTVEEALRTTIGFGGGAQIDRLLRASTPGGEAHDVYEFAPRGFFEIGRRNLGGKNRSINLYTRLSLRPNSVTCDTATATPVEGGCDTAKSSNPFGFSEYRVVGTYREPQAFSGYGDLTGTAAIEQGVRTTFNFARKGFNAELLHRVSPSVRGSVQYSFSTTRVFDEQLTDQEKVTIDRVFPQVRLSEFSGAVARDTRDDVLEPQKGTLVSIDATVAARSLGSQVGFTKGLVEGFYYRNLGRPHLVLAGGARVGLANPFRQVVTTVEADGTTTTEVIRDLPASERFFAGGDTTIRGYALDSVGAPNTISSEGFPIGGSALVILNLEMRTPVWRDLGAAFFIDGGNVFARASEFDLTDLRGATGFGLRYRSPIGPIRIDLGFKMDRRVIGGNLEPRTALHFSIGQAF